MKLFTLWISIFFCHATFAQTSASIGSAIFNPNRTYHYHAVFINGQGDTLSQERITIKPLGRPWEWAKKTQTAIEILYNSNAQDSLNFPAHINPQTKRKKKPKEYTWIESEVTGAIENNEEVWMHPIRSNQYVYTEIAPFPSVKLDSLRPEKKWDGKLLILSGWGAFNGKVLYQYEVKKQEDRRYGGLQLQNCWLIQSVGEHSKLGRNYHDFYYHPQYGFVEMKYSFYDGTKISFTLESVTE